MSGTAVESIDEGGVGSRIIESGSVEQDAVGDAEMPDFGLARDHHGDPKGEVVLSLEAGPTPGDAVANAGRFVVELASAGGTVRGLVSTEGQAERSSPDLLG